MENQTTNTQYDVICIGSGMGSLTVASMLAQFAGKKVLVIERHFQAGGYTHSFARKQGKYHWDVGIHYVGDMHEQGFCRKLMDTITNREVAWNKMSEPFEKFVFPEITFDLYGDADKFKSDLLALFPGESAAIERYFQDLRRMSAIFGKSMMMKNSAPDLRAITIEDNGAEIVTVRDYLDHFFVDNRLKAILAAQWGDYGLPPSKCAFATHASLAVHYFNGGFYPVGGAGKIFDAIAPIIAANGGRVLTSAEVSRVIIREGRAVGVTARALRGEKNETDYYAPVIVSGAGAYPTYLKFIPDSVPIPFREDLRAFYRREKMATSICVYLGLNDDPAKLGFRGENHWLFGSTDHERNFNERNSWLAEFAGVKNMYISFPSLKDPAAQNHTADIIVFADYALFENWKDFPWKKRGDDYARFKQNIADAVIQAVDSRYPGFRRMVDFCEVSTPLTNEHFTAHPDGAIYGLACVPERYDKTASPWFAVETPVPGLFLTGADAGGSPGIAGAMMGGLATTMKIMGGREILKKIIK